jgi:PAS domain S-box-containing protein
MRKSLRARLLFSHLLLVGVLVSVCLIAVAGFFRLSQSVNRILEDNYKSVIAAQEMKEALERMDSAATFFLAGQKERGRKQYAEYLPKFKAAYHIEATNITEPGEQEIADNLGKQFAVYRTNLERLFSENRPMSEAEAHPFYFSTLQPQFVGVKRYAQEVLDINQSAILHADQRAKREAQNATIVSVATALIAVVFGLIFAWRNIHALTTPLVSLARQAEQVGAGHLNQRIEVRRDDEIGLLTRTFNEMAERLQSTRRLEEERLQRAQRMSDTALANLYDPVIVTDAEGKVLHLNRAAEGLFGTARQVRGQAVRSVVQDSRLVQAVDRAIKEAYTSAEEGTAALVEIANRLYRLRVTPMRDDAGVSLGAVAVLEDVTHQEEVNRLKTEFIGVASHELRTPVTSLQLGVDLLREGAVGELTPNQQKVVLALHSDLQRLEQMMRDLLDLTRLEAGASPPRFEVVSPQELLETAQQSIERQAKTQGVLLTMVADGNLPGVRADRGQIGRVLNNLLSNAVRHTAQGGEITLGAVKEEETVRFFVQDTGTGIPPEYVACIFERFVQVPGATRGGAGLGLSLAQVMVQAHHGEITVQSALGEGSTFSFSLHTVGS